MRNNLIGSEISGYKILEELGSGGNADVYLVKNKDENQYALKLLKFYKNKSFNKKYKRFKREIDVVLEVQNKIQGIVPIIHKHLPDKPDNDNRPFYIMEVATPIIELKLKKHRVLEIVKIFKSLATTLSELHEKNIVHRDIKPSNLYIYKKKPAFGDFGLVNYPQTVGLTKTKENVGAKYSIAPEMKRDAKNSDGKAADVYSLAKTLWIQLTGVDDGFEGQYSHKIKDFNVSKYRKEEFIVPLHKLLEKSTDNNPKNRLNINEFIIMLNEYEQIVKEGRERENEVEWKFALENIFTNHLPTYTCWNKPEHIVSVLKELTFSDNINHTFMPSGGGLDLSDVFLSNEAGFVEVVFGKHSLRHLCKMKPKKLSLYTFDDYDWNYFYLETHDISELNVYDHESHQVPVVEISPGKYIKEYNWNYKRNMESENKEHLPEEARHIQLVLKGTYVIFKDRSTYNSIPETYSAIQSYFSEEDFLAIVKLMMTGQCNIKKLHNHISKDRKDSRKATKEKEKLLLSEIFDSLKIDNINFQEDAQAKVFYLIEVFDYNEQKTYFIDESLKILLLDCNDEDWWKYYENRNNKSYFKFYKKEDVEIIEKNISEFIEYCENKTNKKAWYGIRIEIERKRCPNHLFKKKELKDLLFNGNSFINNYLVINEDGYLELLQKEEDVRIYPVKVFEFEARYNQVGEYADLSEDIIDNYYAIALYYWREHLKLNEKINYIDYIDEKNVVKILNDINKLYQDYRDKQN